MANSNAQNSQIVRYLYFLVAIVAFTILVAGISGAFVPEDQTEYTETSESPGKPVTNRGHDISPAE